MVELFRQLESNSQDIVQKVLRENSYFAHPENIVISFLSDTREEVRQRGVLFILETREKFDPEEHPRQFLSPKINFDTLSYEDMINWSDEQKFEPPLTINMHKDEILKGFEQPIILDSYPCHTQDVERVVPVVAESCLQKVGYISRHNWIISTMESRRLVPKFESKKQDV